MVAAAVPLPAAGIWNAVVTLTADGKAETATNAFTVLSKEATPAVGDAAPAARTACTAAGVPRGGCGSSATSRRA